jgi:hypothetical protein
VLKLKGIFRKPCARKIKNKDRLNLKGFPAQGSVVIVNSVGISPVVVRGFRAAFPFVNSVTVAAGPGGEFLPPEAGHRLPVKSDSELEEKSLHHD